ncbi:MAG: DUF3078 domain-containing protein [Bacteroidota bacterium]
MLQKFIITLLVFLLGSLELCVAQPDSLFLRPAPFYGWNTKKEVGFYFNQVSFTNWNAGGTNSISGMLTGRYEARYKDEKQFWNSSINARYGINKQDEQELRKTEDIFEAISNYGYQSNKNSNWFYSARFSFSTQFANGFNYPNTENLISKFMAPGYLFFGAGVEYGKNIERWSLYMSPVTFKTTFVLDEDLANAGAFGVTPAIYDEEGNIIEQGRRIRRELGIQVTNQFEDELWHNVRVKSLLRLYTDYINSFGNIDVDWELAIDLTVNRYIKALLGSHLRYDDDINTEFIRDETTNREIVIKGPRVQWKQILGIGVVVDLDTLIKKEPSS